MKESISMTTIFQIVILFILLFTAIMCLTINNSNAFGVKDELVNIIELSGGNFLVNDGGGNRLNDEMVETIAQEQYRVTGSCDKLNQELGDSSNPYIGYRKDGMPVSSGEKASVCIREVNVRDAMEDVLNQSGVNFIPGEALNGSYYQVVVFYQLNVPVIESVYNMQTKGETRIIYNKNR